MFNRHKYFIILILPIMMLVSGFINISNYHDISNSKFNTKEKSIVLYSTHSTEQYNFGKTIVEITNELKNVLSDYRINCCTIDVPKNTPRQRAFEASKDLIIKNISKYENKVLLDLHIDYNESENKNDGILLIIGKANPNFKNNLQFANKLLTELKKYKNVNSSILIREQVSHNQDLSSQAILIEIGNKSSSEKDITQFILTLQSALKNFTI